MIHISRLNINFKDEKIFQDFNLEVKQGEKVAICGESGKGKTTLLNLLAGFIPDFSGQVTIDGYDLNPHNIQDIRQNMACLPQETFLKMPTVKELFYAPFHFARNKGKHPKPDTVKRVLEVFELPKDILKKKSKEISGGQKQRVLLAACLLMEKPLLLLDEPTSALDKKIKKHIADYILSRKDITLIAATHDEYWISQSDRIIEL